ncbi:hypothetical protein TNCV_1847741 [Trichonephila clavipes]|nr:hypothetical protein TNCV_1847741 [Trichonephila clavipes]
MEFLFFVLGNPGGKGPPQMPHTATQELLATDFVILNHGQVTSTTPELVPPFLTTTPTGGRLSFRQI